MIGGIGLGEQIHERECIIQTVLTNIPEKLVRMITIPGSPIEVLNAVESGIDLIQAAYPFHLTKMAYASTFQIPAVEGPQVLIRFNSYSL